MASKLIMLLSFLSLGLSATVQAQVIDSHPNYDKAVQQIVAGNVTKAIELLRVSAGEGHVDSQFVLALELFKARKEEEGLRWIKLAAQNGNFQAQQMLDFRAQYQ